MPDSTIASFIVHSFCNMIGFPPIDIAISEKQYSKIFINKGVLLTYAIGIISSVYLHTIIETN